MSAPRQPDTCIGSAIGLHIRSRTTHRIRSHSRSRRVCRIAAHPAPRRARCRHRAGGDAPPALSATQQDRLLRFAAVVKDELERSGRSVALIARSGLDLSRFGVRYMAGAVAAFSRLHPALNVEVHSSFSDVDLIAGGYDLDGPPVAEVA